MKKSKTENYNPVSLTTLGVVAGAQDVKINREKIRQLAVLWNKQNIKVPVWPNKMHLETKDTQDMLDYLIILDAINFCVWPIRGKPWTIEYRGRKYSDYFAQSLALKEFFEREPRKGKLEFFSNITFNDFKQIFQGGKNLQFLKRRWQIVKSVSRQIRAKYGSSTNLIKLAKGRLTILLPAIVSLPSFDDQANYYGKTVFFWKRAQILAADIMGALKSHGLGYFRDPQYLTAFADNKLPQILNHFKILEYSARLAQRIRKQCLITLGSPEEVEIRSAAIWAVEYLREDLASLGQKLYSYELDWILWNQSHKITISNPFHLTKTIFY